MAKTAAERQRDRRARERAESSGLPAAVAAMLALTPSERLALVAHLELAIRHDGGSNQPVTIPVTTSVTTTVTNRHDPEPGSRAPAGILDLNSVQNSESSLPLTSSSPSHTDLSSSRARAADFVTSQRDKKRDVTTVAGAPKEQSPESVLRVEFGRRYRAVTGVDWHYAGVAGHVIEVAAWLAKTASDQRVALPVLVARWCESVIADQWLREHGCYPWPAIAKNPGRYLVAKVSGRLLPAADPGDCDDSDIPAEMPKRRRAHG